MSVDRKGKGPLVSQLRQLDGRPSGPPRREAAKVVTDWTVCMPKTGEPTNVAEARSEKEPFDIDEAFRRLRTLVADWPKAAMFDLRDRGFGSPFEQLVGSLISARTRDETTMAVCLRIFEVARTPEQLADLDEVELADLIRPATFAKTKARDLRAIARRIVLEHGGRVPQTREGLTAFRGIGPKIANLTLSLGFGLPEITVDIHVHRVANRWGYVETRTPEQTLVALEAKLPKTYWIEINERLVPFGKFQCTGGAPPKCSTCPLLSMCQQVGVTKTR